MRKFINYLFVENLYTTSFIIITTALAFSVEMYGGKL